MASSSTPAGILTTMLALGLALLFAAPTGGAAADVGSLVTDAFFDGIKSQNQNGDCEGRSFYTRSAFLNAASENPDFANGGSEDDGRREIAAFFAHVTHETGSMCFINEMGGESQDYCDLNYPEWPCASGQKYYGRGPLQLTWNYNYGGAGKKIGFDGLGSPGTVAQDPLVTFQAALWYWMTYAHQVMASQGFGATTKIINSGECDGKAPDKVNDRAKYYKQFCQELSVDPGNNSLTC